MLISCRRNRGLFQCSEVKRHKTSIPYAFAAPSRIPSLFSFSISFFSMQQQQQNWQSGLCAWTEDCSSCIDSMMFPYCLNGASKYKITRNAQGVDCFTVCCPMVGDYLGGGGFCLGLFTCLTRRALVERYRIVEGSCESCCTAFCCPFCSIAQQQREMMMRGEFSGGIFYRPPPPMLPTAAGIIGGMVQHAINKI